METTFTIWMRRIAYGLFSGLFLFELVNFLGVFSYRVEYTWRGLVFSTACVFVVTYGADWFLRKAAGKRLHGFFWLAAILLTFNDFSGDFFGFYGKWTWYDQVVHFLSGPLLVAFFYQIYNDLAPNIGWRHPSYVNLLLAYGTSTTLAVCYEIEEYLEDVFFLSHRLGDGPDTANDLLMNLIGGGIMVGGILLYRWYKKSRSTEEKSST